MDLPILFILDLPVAQMNLYILYLCIGTNMMHMLNIWRLSAFVLIIGCQTDDQLKVGSFGFDLKQVEASEKPMVLTRGDAQLIISEAFQARVITSTSRGLQGTSYGWIDFKALEKNKNGETKYSYGGEDRLWLGPLGSRFSMFYGGNKIHGGNWQVPGLIDTAAFALVSKTAHSAQFEKAAIIKNNVGTSFDIRINRQIDLLSKDDIEGDLGTSIPSQLSYVGFQSYNEITNLGPDWNQENGLIAPWVLGMFPGQENSFAIFPFITSEEKPLAVQKYLNDFGEDRLQVLDSVLLFKTDGKFRSKIGLKSANTKPIIGSFDSKNNVLTIITFSYDASGDFLSSTESEAVDLFGGDVVNSYNNGIDDEGKATFYELESAAPARALATEASISHVHATYHFEGDFKKLNEISKAVLGFDLKGIR